MIVSSGWWSRGWWRWWWWRWWWWWWWWWWTYRGVAAKLLQWFIANLDRFSEHLHVRRWNVDDGRISTTIILNMPSSSSPSFSAPSPPSSSSPLACKWCDNFSWNSFHISVPAFQKCWWYHLREILLIFINHVYHWLSCLFFCLHLNFHLNMNSGLDQGWLTWVGT